MNSILKREQKLPDNYAQVFTAAQISQRVKELALEIDEWIDFMRLPPGEQLLAVCVLRGAFMFFGDLLRELSFSVEPVYCRAESYSTADNHQYLTAKGVKVSVEDVLADGRHLLVVDDICDTGLTLLKLHNVFLDLGAKSVRSVVLIRREIGTSKYEPTWSAFDHNGSGYFVGYGLDNLGKHRNLPDVYVLRDTENKGHN